MKRFLLVMLAVTLLMGIAINSEAGIFGLKAGVYVPNGGASVIGGKAVEGGLSGFSAGPNIEIFYGAVMSPYIHFEAVGGFFSSSKGKTSFYSIPNYLTFKGYYPIGDEFGLFAGAGIGMYYLFVSGNGKTDAPVGFGYHLVLGFDYNIDPVWTVGLDAKWFQSRVSMPNNAPKGLIDIGGLTFNAVAKYHF